MGSTVTLVGFMGSGKSTIGRILAMRLKWPFKDSDAVIEDLEGMPIARIFSAKGEPYFRDLERRVILSTPEEGERVLAVGGGGFTQETIPFLNRLGPTVHLDLTFQEVIRRIGHDARRPLAKDPDLFGLFIKRRALYSHASHRVWTENLTVDEVVDAVMRLV
ncbi:MAG: shikimate kinase [Acidobacteria bacterium]|nr:shikimate kinase [Acidobacteriota bacterium]